MKSTSSLLALASTLTVVLAQDAPSAPASVQDLYNSLQPGPCTDVLQGGFHDTSASDTAEWAYCQQSVKGKAIFLKGNGKFANMDIDCDGSQVGGGAGTRCGASTDTQDQTAFQDTVQTYGIPDLDANVHPYIVFGNQGNYHPTFDPTQYGIQPLSVMAVIVDDKIAYGIWGDTNGDDGPPLVGEASLAMATAFFGDSVNGNAGHDPADVLYIAFTGAGAVPGKDGADWKASSYDQFEASIKGLGDSLMAQLLGGANSTVGQPSQSLTVQPVPTTLATSTVSDALTTTEAQTTTAEAATGTAATTGGSGVSDDCAWAGHCAGTSCDCDDECSGQLTCNSGTCGSAQD